MKLLIYSIPIFLVQLVVSNADVMNGTMKLMMVQAIWRHGDRTPTETYHNDQFTENYWMFGGGGWGQLTPIGMRQHMQLGQKLRARYVNGQPYKFLNTRYNQQEIFVRSTDKNRTLLSAFSNMVGMYGNTAQENASIAGVDYPDVVGWPVGFVPIPIHTIPDAEDHLLSVDNYCPLQDTIWNLAKTTDTVSNYFNSSAVTSLMGNLTNYCGEEINPDNLWILYNALKIEKQYYPAQFKQFTPWYTDSLFEQIDIVNSQVQDFQNGLGLEGKMVNGIDIGKILRKIRGGTLVNDIYNHMNRKTQCSSNNGKECTYTNRLKFFAYSAHDTTLYALFSLLGVAKLAVQPRGYPLYSACALFEQWQDVQTNQTYFKLIYHRHENDTLSNVITSGIPGCEGSGDYCPMAVLKNYSDVFKPEMEMNQWCDVNILKSTSTSSIFSSLLAFSIFYLFVSSK
ncbi:intestinal acid PHOsphatase [Caenorhabditis elegans]|uniref:Intestinal acid PHOsphatase n=1 Tax=Caenorhabditis elegans TaxID=6239 RepID=Q22525_CAEEL|nr:intestinal acid PHOsphatase [Caenorhabditis elegans]CCD68012.1 intestinal acid PHOsphatase [Caenorhabditis elegans]|eukprot:NP_494984.5 intestinal acid PHOsphatase [Caenorhabditis elegans]